MGIDINSLKGIIKDIAENIDRKNCHDGQIDSNELSIFKVGVNIEYQNGKISQEDYNSIFDRIRDEDSQILLEKFRTNNTEPNDATYVKPPFVPPPLPQKEKNEKTIGSHTINTSTTEFMGTKTVETTTYHANGNKLTSTSASTREKDGIKSVSYERKQYNKDGSISKFNSSYTYSKEGLENHVINEGKDKHGNPINDFKSIPEIRNKPEAERTEQEQKLLEEFDNLINFVTKVGEEYGVDPKHILAIIQEEVAFDGLGKRKGSVTGVNGKGYMQLTTSPVADFLGSNATVHGKYVYSKDAKEKISVYGTEMEELLVSRGFNPEDAKTPEQKSALQQEIMDYLKENKDPEFNIRMGTLVFRAKLKSVDGDLQSAAVRYNGSSDRVNYGKRVAKYANELQKTVDQDTVYNFERRKNV